MAWDKWLKITVYPLHFTIVDNMEDLQKVWDALDITEDDRAPPGGKASTYHYVSKSTGYLACVVYLADTLSWNPYTVSGVAAHEAMHVIQNLWDHIGERRPGWEAEAYLMQALVEEIMDFIEERHPYKPPRAKKRKTDS